MLDRILVCASNPKRHGCCGKEAGNEGCIKTWSCCEQTLDNEGCQWRYKCCQMDVGKLIKITQCRGGVVGNFEPKKVQKLMAQIILSNN